MATTTKKKQKVLLAKRRFEEVQLRESTEAGAKVLEHLNAAYAEAKKLKFAGYSSPDPGVSQGTWLLGRLKSVIDDAKKVLEAEGMLAKAAEENPVPAKTPEGLAVTKWGDRWKIEEPSELKDARVRTQLWYDKRNEKTPWVLNWNAPSIGDMRAGYEIGEKAFGDPQSALAAVGGIHKKLAKDYAELRKAWDDREAKREAQRLKDKAALDARFAGRR